MFFDYKKWLLPGGDTGHIIVKWFSVNKGPIYSLYQWCSKTTKLQDQNQDHLFFKTKTGQAKAKTKTTFSRPRPLF